MQICQTVAEMRNTRHALRDGPRGVALVPTMGALHAGHMALVAAARAAQPAVVVSIFVNPTQFGDPSDLEHYPRTLDADLALLRDAGVDAVFTPQAGDLYPEGDQTIVETTRLANTLHGALRPGHYRGVTTVVTKLFNIVQPDSACFGEKDYQQLQVIRAMVRDLFMPIEIIGVPTARAPDGLALSSRNSRLSKADRKAAVVLSQALDEAERAAAEGARAEALRDLITQTIAAEPRADLRAVDITHASTLEPLSGPVTGKAAIMLSAQFGDVLLIDQREVSGPAT